MALIHSSPSPANVDERAVAKAPNGALVELVQDDFPDIPSYRIPSTADFDTSTSPMTVLCGESRLFFVDNRQVGAVRVVGTAVGDVGVIVPPGSATAGRRLLTTNREGHVLPIGGGGAEEPTAWKGIQGPVTQLGDGAYHDLIQVPFETLNANDILMLEATASASLAEPSDGEPIRFRIVGNIMGQGFTDIVGFTLSPRTVNIGELPFEYGQSGAVVWMLQLPTPSLYTFKLQWRPPTGSTGNIDAPVQEAQHAALRVTLKPGATIVP